MVTVKELREALDRFPADAPIYVTWESTVVNFSIYQAKDGTVLIDADDDTYRPEFESGEMPVRKPYSE